MMGNTAHRNSLRHASRLSGQDQIEFPARCFGVIKEHLIEIPDTVKKQHIRVLFMYFQIMLDHR